MYIIRQFEFNYSSCNNNDGCKFEVIITSPETCVISDNKSSNLNKRELSKIKWVYNEKNKLYVLQHLKFQKSPLDQKYLPLHKINLT